MTTQSVGQAFCPTVPPFLGSLSLNVQAGDVSISVSQVQLTFTDSFGATAPQVTLPAPVMTQQFGSTLVAARSQRTFPLQFPFGCGTSRTGTLVVVVVTREDNGREITTQASVGVR